MKTFKHILVPTDFSDTAREALRAAREIAIGASTRLSLVHVISDVWRQPWTAEAGVDLAAFQAEWREEAKKRLVALVDEEGLDAAGVTTAVLVGTPKTAIVQYADGQHVDLIVMGAQGHGVVRRFLMGSVAERVVRSAHCPVLTVPHHILRGHDPDERSEEAAMSGAISGHELD